MAARRSDRCDRARANGGAAAAPDVAALSPAARSTRSGSDRVSAPAPEEAGLIRSEVTRSVSVAPPWGVHRGVVARASIGSGAVFIRRTG